MLRRLFTSRFKEFLGWCSSDPDPGKPSNLALADKIEKNAPYEKFAAVFEDFNKKLRGKSKLNITLDRVPSPAASSANKELVLSGSSPSQKGEIFRLNCSVLPTHPYTVVGRSLRVWECFIGHSQHNTSVVKLEDCEVATLWLDHAAKVELRNTKVGTLVIKDVSLIDMEGGCVLNIDIPTPGGSNPLKGSVDFVRTFFPRNRTDWLLQGPQPYRNMRFHLRNIENGQMANLFHSAELAVERDRDTRFNRILSYAYELFSDFGSSAARPIIWWFTVAFLVAGILYSADGVVPSSSANEHFVGWRAVLVENGGGYLQRAAKALYLSFNTMLNPLDLLSYRALLVPGTPALFVLSLAQALLSAVLVALLILAIRRRFKMS